MAMSVCPSGSYCLRICRVVSFSKYGELKYLWLKLYAAQTVEPQPIRPGRYEAVPGQLMMPEFVRPHMPLADVRGPVTVAPQYMAEAFMFRAQPNLVDHHAGARLILARHQRSAMGAHTGVDEIAWWKLHPSAARRSIFGVRAYSSPA